jgi:hypothetical protein
MKEELRDVYLEIEGWIEDDSEKSPKISGEKPNDGSDNEMT